MPTTFKPLFGTNNQTITIVGNSLANASSVFSSAIDNSSNLYVDVLVAGSFAAAAASVSATGTISIIVAASSDGGSNYTSRTQDCKVLAVLDCSANSATPRLDPVSVASVYGGHLPQFFKIGIINNSGTALNAAGNNSTMYYQGVNDQGV